MNVLVIGYGSIGRRHVDNLTHLETVTKIVVCTRPEFRAGGLDLMGKVKFADSLTCALNAHLAGDRFDFAVIANETSKHIDTAILLAQAGLNLFIEKPLSHNVDKLERLKKILNKSGLKAFVAYNMRFLGAIRWIREELLKQSIGKPYFARIEVGQYLPSWRCDRDFRNSYSVSKERGGGVALDLSHEVDYMRFLFGEPTIWKVLSSQVSDLEMDVDDVFEGLYLFDKGFVCSIHMDYLQSRKVRTLRIVGEKGILVCDFIGNLMHMIMNNGIENTFLSDDNLFDINRTYIEELDDFIHSLHAGTDPAVTLNDGLRVLELLEDSHV
jgi:predicted dehydrogenase